MEYPLMLTKANTTEGPIWGICFFSGPDPSRRFYLRVDTDHGVLHLSLAGAYVADCELPDRPGVTVQGTQLVFNWVVHEDDVRISSVQVRCEVVSFDDVDDPEGTCECDDEAVGPVVNYRYWVIPAGETACWIHQLDWVWEPAEEAPEEEEGEEDEPSE